MNEVETVVRDQRCRVVAAVGCLRCGGASHPGSLGIKCQNWILRVVFV